MIKIDLEGCIGCGSCVVVAKNVYEMGGDGKAHVKDGMDEPEGDALEKAKKGADICPVDVIEIK